MTDAPVPDVHPGWVRIRVMAFGVNESEATSRRGDSSADFSFPRILGIEDVGVVDARNVIPFTGDPPWDTLGALPEMLQTAHGSSTAGLALHARQNILIHGGISSAGLTATAVAHYLGAKVIATTRDPARFDRSAPKIRCTTHAVERPPKSIAEAIRRMSRQSEPKSARQASTE